MSSLRGLCDRDRLAVCTIHQPSMEIYALFDLLTLLAEGRLVYHGPAQGQYLAQTRSTAHMT